MQKRMTPIGSDVERSKKKDNATAVTTVEDGYEVCKISLRTRNEVFNKWINNRRLRRKVPTATGTFILNYLKEGGKWKRLGWACRTEFPLIETKNIVLELIKPVTQETDVSNENESNKKDADMNEVVEGNRPRRIWEKL